MCVLRFLKLKALVSEKVSRRKKKRKEKEETNLNSNFCRRHRFSRRVSNQPGTNRGK